MNAVLYPNRMLAVTSGDKPGSDPRPTPFCSAVLLYFDSVILASAALPNECAFAIDFEDRERKLRDRFGPEVLTDYQPGRLSTEDSVFILWRHYSSDWIKFLRNFEPLFRENIVELTSLVGCINRMRAAAQEKNDLEALRCLDLRAVLHNFGFMAETKDFLGKPLDSASKRVVLQSMGQADQPAAAAAFLCDLLKDGAILDTTNLRMFYELW